jgi:putative component of membrane protein insertase Oxa1/YidC/SpoIIIJ protein YidD
MRLAVAFVVLLAATIAAPGALPALAVYNGNHGPIYMETTPGCSVLSHLAVHPGVFYLGGCDGYGTAKVLGHWHHWGQWKAWARVALSIRRSCAPTCPSGPRDAYVGYAWVHHPECSEYIHQAVKITGYKEPYREPLRIGHTWRFRNLGIGCGGT